MNTVPVDQDRWARLSRWTCRAPVFYTAPYAYKTSRGNAVLVSAYQW